MTTSKKFSGFLSHRLIQKAVSSKIAVRVVVSGDETKYHTMRVEHLLLNSNLKAKFISDKVFASVLILDDHEAMISSSLEEAFARSPVYWSNNPCVVEVCKTYFEKYWEKRADDRDPFDNSRKFSDHPSEYLLTA